jgi:5-hydroxyisourate hydrolase-like protein (transthyretin family)
VVLSVFLGGGNTILWTGSNAAVLAVTVIDTQTGLPIPNASVRLSGEHDDPRVSEGRTDANGRIRLTHEFRALGTDSTVTRTGVFYPGRETLQVDAEGYKGVSEPVSAYIQSVWGLYGPPLPAVQVSLDKKGNE